MIGERCRLVWWANSSLALCSVEVAVTITADWSGDGRLLSEDPEEWEGLVFFCELDPAFTLTFEDGSTVPVIVSPGPERGRFTLIEDTGPQQRPVRRSFDIRADPPGAAGC